MIRCLSERSSIHKRVRREIVEQRRRNSPRPSCKADWEAIAAVDKYLVFFQIVYLIVSKQLSL